MQQLPSQELIQRAIDGDPKAQNGIVELSIDTVIRWATRLSGPRVDPEDVSHDALMTALERLDTLRDSNKFEPWLYGITRRTVAKYRRKAWVQKWVGPPVQESSDPQSCLEQNYLRSEQARQVQRVLEELSAKHREVLVLNLVEDRSGAEIAQLLSIPEGTVRGRLRAARRRFTEAAEKLKLSIDLNGPLTSPWSSGPPTLGGT